MFSLRIYSRMHSAAARMPDLTAPSKYPLYSEAVSVDAQNNVPPTGLRSHSPNVLKHPGGKNDAKQPPENDSLHQSFSM